MPLPIAIWARHCIEVSSGWADSYPGWVIDAIVCDVLKTWVFLRNLKGPEHDILMVSGRLHNKNKFQIATSSPTLGWLCILTQDMFLPLGPNMTYTLHPLSLRRTIFQQTSLHHQLIDPQCRSSRTRFIDAMKRSLAAAWGTVPQA